MSDEFIGFLFGWLSSIDCKSEFVFSCRAIYFAILEKCEHVSSTQGALYCG